MTVMIIQIVGNFISMFIYFVYLTKVPKDTIELVLFSYN